MLLVTHVTRDKGVEIGHVTCYQAPEYLTVSDAFVYLYTTTCWVPLTAPLSHHNTSWLTLGDIINY